jgi:tripartite-type tricarboxylate transporter receptor subunit TctC
MGRMLRIMLAAALVAAAAARPALAQDDAAKGYPSRPIHIVVGFSAGGGTDILARLFGQKLSESFGQQVVIDNKPGAGSIIGAEFAAKAAPDGYTLLLGASGAMSVNPAVYAKLPYDSLRDFAPITMIGSFPLILVVSPKMPIRTVAEFVAYTKANPEKSNYAAPSVTFQLAAELFKLKTGAVMEHVAYKGGNDAALAVVSGEVLCAMIDSPALAGQLQAGQVRGLAVTAPQRSAEFPEIPTIAEAGVAGAEYSLWTGFFAPAKTPPAIVAKLQQEIVRILALPDIGEKMKALLVDPVGNTPAEFGAVVASEIERYSAIAKAANVKIEQ